MRIANVLFELGHKEEAFAEARALQGDASADDEARRGAYLLEAELKQKDDDDAGELDVLARGLAAYPDDNALLYARGLAWERRDRIDRAEADLRKILVTDPENVAALNALGYTLADRTTRYQEALELIDRAARPSPTSRDHRQLWLGALSPGPQRRGAGRIAPRFHPAEGCGNRRAHRARCCG